MTHLPLARVIAHRGASGDAPENTLAALELAAVHGAHCVEIDVSISLDRVPFVHHDDTLERCTNGAGLLSEHTAGELDRLCAGRKQSGFVNEPLPRLDAVISLLKDHRLGLNLEIKPYQGLEQTTVEAISRDLHESWPSDLPLVFSSFSHECLDMIREYLPQAGRAPLVGAIPDTWQTLMQRYDAHNLHCDANTLDPELARAVVAAGYGLYCYTVNDVDRARTLFNYGVHGVFTDYPKKMLAFSET